MGKKHHIYVFPLLAAFAAATVFPAAPSAEAETYFVDGYHGGIYGHYPVEWKTQFIVDKVQENPQWRIGLEIEPETWDTVRVRTPQAYEAFVKMMQGGHAEFTNPTYAQPYCYNVTGESLIRQFRYGIAKLRNHFPGITFTTYAAEEPCFTSCLPAVLKGFGFKYASLKCPNTCWGGYMAAYGGQLVNWIGPDGTSILTVPRYACEELEAKSVWQTTAWGNSRKYLDACRRAGIENPVGMTYQDAGWRNGPWLKDGRGSVYTLWTDYIANHTDPSKATDYRMPQDDVLVNLMWGGQVLQRIAQQVRQAENRMLMAEKMGAIAMLATKGGRTKDKSTEPDRAAIDEAWRQLMLAQHHDSWIVPYNGLWHFGTWADAIGQWTNFAVGAADGEMARLASAVTPGDRVMVKVFNTQGIARTEVVQVELPDGWGDSGVALSGRDGKTLESYIVEPNKSFDDIKNNKVKRLLTFKATVPPLGYATYRLSRVAREEEKVIAPAAPRGEEGKEIVLENDRVRLIFDLGRGGTVKSLILKDERRKDGKTKDKSGVDGMEYAAAEGDYAMGELRGYFYDEDCFRSSTETPARVTAVTDSPLGKSVTIEGEIAGHPFTQTYAIASGSSRVDCDLRIDWQGNPGIGEYKERHWNHDRRAFCDDRYKLLVLFPTSFAQSALTKDAPFDVCRSRNENTFFSRWSEIKHNIILNWVDVTGGNSGAGSREPEGGIGLGILTDHTTSYVHGADHPLGLTLQYTGQGLWGRNYPVKGPTQVRFAIVPHGADGVAAMENAADEFNEPLQAFVCGGDNEPSVASLCEISAPGYRVSSAANENGTLALRLYNSHADQPAKVSVSLPGAEVLETDLMGENPSAVEAKEERKSVTFTADMPRHGFRTFAVR